MKGYFVLFGFVDVYVYLCEFGGEYKEIIEIGIKVVVRGGFIIVCLMFNIRLVLDFVEYFEVL